MRPERTREELYDPALKFTEGMQVALGVADEYAAEHPGVTVRLIDADTLLEPRTLTRRAPRDVVEIFIDPSGVLVVGTGWDSTRPVFRVAIPLPDPADEVSVYAFGSTLRFDANWALRAVGSQSQSGLHGTASP